MPCAEAALDGAGVAEVADVSDTSSQSRPHAPQNEPAKAGRIGQVTDSFPYSQPESPFGDIKVKRLDKELPLPKRAHRGDAGADLYAAEALTLQPGERALVGTGIAIALPLGTVGLIHPRSGLAAKQGLSVVNTQGTVDADYRGEIKVCLINHDRHTPIEIERGMRIAQLVVAPSPKRFTLCSKTTPKAYHR